MNFAQRSGLIPIGRRDTPHSAPLSPRSVATMLPIEEFKLALKEQPNFVPALDGLAKALIEQHRYSAAIAYLKDAPPDAGLELNLAIAYSKNGNPDEAIRILTHLVKDQPGSAQAHSNLGIAYTQQDRYREAAAEFKTALEIDPTTMPLRVSYIQDSGSYSPTTPPHNL